jgi:acetyltransferase (GNAT) family protein
MVKESSSECVLRSRENHHPHDILTVQSQLVLTSDVSLRSPGAAVGCRRVARALVEELERLGHERGCGIMWVLTDEDNAAAMGLYRSTGGYWNGSHQVMFEYDLGEG